MIAFFFFFFFDNPEYDFNAHLKECNEDDKDIEQYYSQVFAERLKAARQKQTPPKTQKQLAEAIGVSTNSLCNYEKGWMPSLTNALKLADVLGVSLDYLFARGSGSELCDKPSLGILARNIITLSKQQGMHLEANGSPTLAVEHDRLGRFLAEYLDYSKALEAEPNSAMQKMFEAWMGSQLRELDQIPLE